MKWNIHYTKCYPEIFRWNIQANYWEWVDEIKCFKMRVWKFVSKWEFFARGGIFKWMKQYVLQFRKSGEIVLLVYLWVSYSVHKSLVDAFSSIYLVCYLRSTRNNSRSFGLNIEDHFKATRFSCTLKYIGKFCIYLGEAFGEVYLKNRFKNF